MFLSVVIEGDILYHQICRMGHWTEMYIFALLLFCFVFPGEGNWIFFFISFSVFPLFEKEKVRVCFFPIVAFGQAT